MLMNMATTPTAALEPLRIRKELAQAWEQDGGNAVLFSAAAGSDLAFLQDPRARFLMLLAQTADQKARLLYDVNQGWCQRNGLPEPPSRLAFSPGLIAAALARFQPFGWPELMRLRRTLAASAQEFKEQLLRLSREQPGLFPGDRLGQLSSLADHEVSLADQIMSTLATLTLDADPGDSYHFHPWDGAAARHWPLPGRDFPKGPHYEKDD